MSDSDERESSGRSAGESASGPEGPDLGGSSALLAMLVVFGVIALMTLLATIGPPATPRAEARSVTAYGPENFPEVFRPVDEMVQGLHEEPEDVYSVPPPPFNDPTIFPCSDCHEGDPGDPTPRELAFHEEIEFHHAEENRWCLDCHLDVNRDVLHLADMRPVPFAESYRLCGQCHGHEYADWRAGAHGRRVGYWNGPKRYLLCVHCHDPHEPHFRPIEPLPPPVAPHYMTQAERAAPRDPGGDDE